MEERIKDLLERVKSSNDFKGIWDEIKADDDFAAEVNSLTAYDLIDENKNIKEPEFFKGLNESVVNTNLNIFRALAWKNKDLKKEEIIIAGFNGKDEEDHKKSRVFYQYGQFLKTYIQAKEDSDYSKVYPIIDRNTFCAFYYLQNGTILTPPQSNGKIKKEFNKYNDWYMGKVKSKDDFLYLNAIMFVLGKALYKKNNKE